MEIENWCKKNFENKETWERRLPSRLEKSEKRLGEALASIKQNILKQYEGKELEEIENEEDRKIAEIVRRLDEEYNPKKTKTATGLGKKVAKNIPNEEIKKDAKFVEEIMQTKEKNKQGVDYND